MKTIKYIIDTIESGLYYFCYTLSKGFFFYFYLIASLLSKIIPLKPLKNLKEFFRKKQGDTLAFLSVVFVFLIGVFVYTHFYIGHSEIKYVTKDILNKSEVQERMIPEKSNELNLFRKYAEYNTNAIDFKELKKVNKDVVAWLIVDGTSINYPIVQTKNNDYYLNHDINKDIKSSGWTFMDYRNKKDLSNDNTIIYGHNLVNKTSFGSISNMFEEKWFNKSNHYIVLINEEGKHIYEIFSVYEIDPEVYYLQNEFESDDSTNTFFNILKQRSIYKFKTKVNGKDKIITLSTCTEDNKHRRVVHAKLIEK